MYEGHFNHALTVLEVVRFFAGRPARRFFAPGGSKRAAGLLGVGLCARPSQRRGRDEGWGRRSASRAKAPGTSPGASFLSPLSLATQRKGARGAAGARSPRGLAWASLHSALRPRQNTRERCGTLSIATRHATSLQTPESPSGRTLALVGGHSRVGGQLSARPYSTAPTESAIANRANWWKWDSQPHLYHDAARRVATVFEKWNCMTEKYLPARRASL